MPKIKKEAKGKKALRKGEEELDKKLNRETLDKLNQFCFQFDSEIKNLHSN